jgi:hypothetical protein
MANGVKTNLLSSDLHESGRFCTLMLHWHTWKTEAMAPTGGLEPPTFRLGGGYSILLNYVGEG